MSRILENDAECLALEVVIEEEVLDAAVSRVRANGHPVGVDLLYDGATARVDDEVEGEQREA